MCFVQLPMFYRCHIEIMGMISQKLLSKRMGNQNYIALRIFRTLREMLLAAMQIYPKKSKIKSNLASASYVGPFKAFSGCEKRSPNSTHISALNLRSLRMLDKALEQRISRAR